MMQWPKPVQKPHPPIIVGAHSPTRQNGRSPMATAGFRSAAGPPIRSRCCRNSVRWQGTPAAIPRRSPLMSSGRRADLDVLKRYRDAGVDRVVLMLPPKPRDAILPMLDEGAALVTAL